MAGVHSGIHLVHGHGYSELLQLRTPRVAGSVYGQISMESRNVGAKSDACSDLTKSRGFGGMPTPKWPLDQRV